jgi:AraC-like DNA-binding protein
MISGNSCNSPSIAMRAGNLDSRFLRQTIGKEKIVLFEQTELSAVKSVKLTGMDENQAFLNKVAGIVEHRITDGSFDFNQFALEMKVTKSTLQRKINQLIGLTPCKLIHSFRIEIALQLLSNHSLNISEVAYKTGFNDPKYFSRRFKEEVGLSPKEYRKSLKRKSVSVDSRTSDELFLEKALVKLEMRMSEGNLSFERFASEMNVSKASLYRKLKSVSGQSPCEFIRSVRIKRSAQLLGKHKNIADVAFEVGFNDSKYFSRCFKNEFGISPKQYQELMVS